MIYDFTFQNRYKKIRVYEAIARKILDVYEESPEWIIRNNYIKLAKEYHPDVSNHKNDDFFKDINTAYSILTKPDFDIESTKFLTISYKDEEDIEEELKNRKRRTVSRGVKNDYYSSWRDRFF